MQSETPSNLATTAPQQTFAVDSEHSQLRLLIIGMFAAGVVLGYIILNILIPNSGLNILALLGSLLVGYATAAVSETILKTRWPSGRTLDVTDDQVILSKNGRNEIIINTTEAFNTLTWRFENKRRARVPKGWYVVAHALQQNDTMLIVYTFASPEQFKAIPQSDRFTTLIAKNKTDKKSSNRDALLLAGEQRRLLEAEQNRWYNGAEMPLADFQTYLLTIRDRFLQ